MGKSYIYHDSQNTFYREPFGAVSIGTKVKICLECKEQGEVSIEVIKFDGFSYSIPMMIEKSKEGCTLYKGIIDTTDSLGILNYYFKYIKDGFTQYYGNNDENLGGEGKIYYEFPKYYQITVYNKNEIPNWYKEGIIYQIFVDRFFNGNKDNEILDKKKNIFIYGSWYDEPMYIRDNNGNIERWDFYGGNLRGVIKKLDYIKSLGANIIYMNPIFDAASCHKYDTGDYEAIDRMYGSTEDFIELCQKASEKGIRIILDGVFSHTGSDSRYFNKYGNYSDLGAYESKYSKYYKWYRFYDYPNNYECWWGFENQPNVEELEKTYLDYIVNNDNSIVEKWLKLGASGWRLDVADELPDEFIQMIKNKMKNVKKESVLIGEVWEDASNKVSYSKRRKYLLGNELDSVTNYPYKNIISDFLNGYITSKDFYKVIMSIKENYPRENFYANMNLLGNHDTERVFTVLNENIKKLKLAICIQMTLPGVPLIYYGDEAGLLGHKDPENRKTYPWGRENKETLRHYSFFGNFRKNEEVLKKGEFYIYKDTPDEIIAFKRFYENKEMIIIINRDIYNKRITLNTKEGEYKNKFSDEVFYSNGNIIVEIEGESYKILTN
ncbi:glycoside hydrolase family 13 protein [Clostridium sp. LIBA-8841]|uniref:glycoside hydrolase family 13 protein n=1 Tax=Clostridium sp. LIBA-8841 TaxID=2987530 RepID=UPI002AC561D9|nr:glycoside hydrolase family 13 protein [Clostridium sp. LIBA-8841]MDZ5255373.1 glycoside hydrolase family 13 protein [Clostridium sp. LIBA-8841]